jgi:hypothetical protein
MFAFGVSIVASSVASSVLTSFTQTTFRAHVEGFLSEYVESFEWGQSDDSAITLHRLVMKERAMNDILKPLGLRLCDSKSFTISHLKLKVNWEIGVDLGILSRPWHIEIDGARLCTCIDASTAKDAESNARVTEQGSDLETAGVEQGGALHKIVENAKISFRDFNFQCKDAMNGDSMLWKFREANLTSTDHQWNDEQTTNEVEGQGTLYKRLSLNDLVVEIEEDKRRCCVVNQANISCKMQKKIKPVLSGSLASDFLGEEYSLLFDVNISNPECKLKDLPFVITWDKTTSSYSIVAQEGATLRVSCAVNPCDISALLKWHSRIVGKMDEQWESNMKNKLNILNLRNDDSRENLNAQKQLVNELNSRVLRSQNDLSDAHRALAKEKEERETGRALMSEKSLQDKEARDLALDEKLGQVLGQIETMKSKSSPAGQAELSSIQAMVKDIMCNADNLGSPDTWKDISGRSEGSKDYEFGDLTRSALGAFFS